MVITKLLKRHIKDYAPAYSRALRRIRWVVHQLVYRKPQVSLEGLAYALGLMTIFKINFMLQSLTVITLEVSNDACNLLIISRIDRKWLVGSSKSFNRQEDGPRKTKPLLSARDVVWQTAKTSEIYPRAINVHIAAVLKSIC